MLSEKQKENFWKKVQLTNSCWNWVGYKHRGYGQFGTQVGVKLAHRISYFLEHGFLPTDKLILHSCDNPSCVNPKHLWAGTYQDNMTDMSLKKRGKGPEKINQEIANKVRSSNLSCVKLSKQYGICATQVWRIKKGFHWQQ